MEVITPIFSAAAEPSHRSGTPSEQYCRTRGASAAVTEARERRGQGWHRYYLYEKQKNLTKTCKVRLESSYTFR